MIILRLKCSYITFPARWRHRLQSGGLEDPVQTVTCLFARGAGLQATHQVQPPDVRFPSAGHPAAFPKEQRLKGNWDRELGAPADLQRSLERGWCHSDDCELVFVDYDLLSDRCGVCAESITPVAMADYNHRRR